MSIGTVQINRLNMLQGDLGAVGRHFLFIGAGATNTGTLLNVSNETDLDTALGGADSTLKTEVTAARLNAGQNWYASVLPIADAAAWEAAVDFAMTKDKCEAIVLVDDADEKADLETMHAKAKEIMAKYMRPVFFMASVRGIDDTTESWAEYVTAIKPITDGVAADQVMVVPSIWGDDLGTLAGRLCNRAVTVADSPMRVKTGPLIGTWADRPVDKDGVAIGMADLKSLDSERFSVPQWYPDYDGTYWADGNLLDVEGGDYQVIENLRVTQKAMRRIYPRAVARIGDQSLNSTPVSIEQTKAYLKAVLRPMTKSVTIQDTTFPGEIRPLADDAIVIVWIDNKTVQIYMKIRPYECPKDITVNLILDLSSYLTAA